MGPKLIQKFLCPRCGERLLRRESYCRFCGQEIDWKDIILEVTE